MTFVLFMETYCQSGFECFCHFCQVGEKKGLSPEEVFTSVKVTGESTILSCSWLKTELPLILDQIRMLVATSFLQSVSDKTSAVSTPQHTCTYFILPLCGTFLLIIFTSHRTCQRKPHLLMEERSQTLQTLKVGFSYPELRPSRPGCQQEETQRELPDKL